MAANVVLFLLNEIKEIEANTCGRFWMYRLTVVACLMLRDYFVYFISGGGVF